MIFWTLVAAVVGAVSFTVYRSTRDGYNDRVDHFLAGVLAFVASGLVAFVIMFIAAVALPWNNDLVSESKQPLRALGTSSGIEGRSYFLGGGYVNSKRVLNYITTDDDGAIKVRQADAEDSTIYENEPTPYVIRRHYDQNNPWVFTWPGGAVDRYEFRIPAGSVLNDYAIDNK